MLTVSAVPAQTTAVIPTVTPIIIPTPIVTPVFNCVSGRTADTFSMNVGSPVAVGDYVALGDYGAENGDYQRWSRQRDPENCECRGAG